MVVTQSAFVKPASSARPIGTFSNACHGLLPNKQETNSGKRPGRAYPKTAGPCQASLATACGLRANANGTLEDVTLVGPPDMPSTVSLANKYDDNELESMKILNSLPRARERLTLRDLGGCEAMVLC